jgi:5-methylcytosine-specific restriction endonuclease McrA
VLQRCKKCGEVKPASREFFGSTPTGNLRGTCRTCMAEHTAKHDRNIGASHRVAVRRERTDAFRITEAQRGELWRKQDGRCPCCWKLMPAISEAEADHVIPVSRGGRDDIANIMLVHSQCNREKHNKTLEEHWEWRVKVGLDKESIRSLFDR